MKKETLKEKTISGLKIRTKNIDEMNPKTAKLGNLWKEFDKKVPVDYKNGDRVYGVYFNYESDENGKFSVLAGCDKHINTKIKLKNVVLQAGNYLIFEAEATSNNEQARITAVIKTWGEIWEYFKNNNTYTRAYKTDFEYYKNQTQIDICIGIL